MNTIEKVLGFKVRNLFYLIVTILVAIGAVCFFFAYAVPYAFNDAINKLTTLEWTK